MGYFSNGTEGDMYEDQWCSKCIHYRNCAVWDAHALRNYDECNKEDSILHLLIPRNTKDTFNGKCKMFIRGKAEYEEQQKDEQLLLKYEEAMKSQPPQQPIRV